MSIIIVSGDCPGKINRVYGSSSYVQSQSKKKTTINTELVYYTNIVKSEKRFVKTKKTKQYIKMIQEHGNILQEKILIKILHAYKDTLLVGKNMARVKIRN